MAFWRPGAAAPGVGIERPEDFNDAEAASTIGFNPRHSLPLQQQRNMLPIARWVKKAASVGLNNIPSVQIAHKRRPDCLRRVRNNILYAMEKYRTLVIVGETGSGKSTQIPQVRAGQLHRGWHRVSDKIERRCACTTAVPVRGRLDPRGADGALHSAPTRGSHVRRSQGRHRGTPPGLSVRGECGTRR